MILNVSLARGLAFPPYVMVSLDPHVPEALWLWLESQCSGGLADSMFNLAGVGRFLNFFIIYIFVKLRWVGLMLRSTDGGYGQV